MDKINENVDMYALPLSNGVPFLIERLKQYF